VYHPSVWNHKWLSFQVAITLCLSTKGNQSPEEHCFEKINIKDLFKRICNTNLNSPEYIFQIIEEINPSLSLRLHKSLRVKEILQVVFFRKKNFTKEKVSAL
jgi:hypothetical protein